MGSGKRAKLECSRGMQQEHTLGPDMFCLPLRPVHTKVREECESQAVETYPYLDHITIAAYEISPGPVGVMPFFEKDLTMRGIHLNPGKTIA